jgi:protein ImuB
MERDLPTRVLAVWCPDWPVLALGGDHDRPVAVVEAGRVAVCSAAARAGGVRRGMRLREAQRRCPELEAHAPDPGREARMFEPVIAVLEGLAPAVEVVRPGLCVLSVAGPARYAGGEERLAGLVRDSVAEVETGDGVPVACGVGIADGAFAAILAARDDGIVPRGQSPDFLADLPVTVLERPELAEVLVPLGIVTLGRFAELPPARVAERFGLDGVLAHRLARGLDARPLAVRRPGEEAVFAASRLAERLHERLAAAGLACVRLGVRIETAGGRVSWRLWRHDGVLSSLAVAERVRWQLDAWRSQPTATEDDQPDGISLLRLVPDQLVVDTGRQLGLWGAGEVPDEVERAAQRVQAMLGSEIQSPDSPGVVRLLHAGGRDPAARAVRVPWGSPVPAAKDGAWPPTVPDPEPSRVFAELRPAELLDAEGRATGVSGRARLEAAPAWLVTGDTAERLRVTGWAGPWPASEHWWSGERSRRRAYLQAVTADGRAWLLAVEDGRWHLAATYED